MNIFGIPYQRLTVKSHLSPNKVEDCLKSLVWNHPIYWLRSKGSAEAKQFVGEFSQETFRLQRLYGTLPLSKSIFKPTFYGTIESHQGGSQIKIKIALDPIELTFAVAILLLLLYGAIVEHSIYFLILAVVFDLLQYLISFAPDVRFFEKYLLSQLQINFEKLEAQL